MKKLFLLAGLCACGGGGTNDPATDAAPDAELGPGVVFINEVMPANKTACMDIVGEFDDWIELYNAGDTDLSLEKYTITDDPTMPAKAVLPAGITVPAHGFKLLWADDQVQGIDHLAFKLNADGESIALFTPGGTMIDSYAWATAADDQAFARFPDGSGAMTACARSSCGQSNGAACGAVQ